MYGQQQAVFQAGNAIRREIADAILRGGRAPGAAAEAHAAIAVRLREVERGVDEGLFGGFRAAAQLAPLAAALLLLSSNLALAALIALVPFAIALGQLRRHFRAGNARATQLAEELHAGVDELVRHLDLWRTYGAGARVQRALDAAGREASQASARADAARVALSGGNEALAAGALLGVVAFVERGILPLGQGSLVAFAAVFFLMYRPLRDLGDARTAIERGAEALASLDRLRSDVVEVGPEGRWDGADDTGLHARAGNFFTHAPGGHDPCVVDPARVGTAFRAGAGDRHDVRGSAGESANARRWTAERLVVQGLVVERDGWASPATSLTAEPGEIVALVGPTGSGKTTLLRALLGLTRAARGRVLYGEHDLGGAGVGPDQRPFAWVPQEAAIVGGTLEENVQLGAGSAGDARSAQALLEGIGAGSLARRGVAARLKAGGHELSGGERQWVAIARALASELPVLLLDEPTSGLDGASQERVLAALAALRGQRTVILVTHRPEPLAIADRVVRIGEGEGRVERGSHAPAGAAQN